jgi:hypothetical protein
MINLGILVTIMPDHRSYRVPVFKHRTTKGYVVIEARNKTEAAKQASQLVLLDPDKVIPESEYANGFQLGEPVEE